MPFESDLTPKKIVEHLDQHIIGQADAKRAMAIAIRNRWRRLQVNPNFRQEIIPKNILMVGPTGVGKTEISRRLAHLVNAPVEATKFTQIGYVGKDVESIIRDLTQVAFNNEKQQALICAQELATEKTEEKILDILVPSDSNKNTETREKILKQLKLGSLNHKKIDIHISETNNNFKSELPGMEEMAEQLGGFMKLLNKQTKKRRLTIKEAKKELQNEVANELVDDEKIRKSCVLKVEQEDIVFIDEIDKIAYSAKAKADDVSHQGVQRDLLPLIEGTTVQTKFGNVNTDHILFIACGAFQQVKPSDLIAELQGRLPIRVELSNLTVEDFKCILSETSNPLLKQYSALLEIEGVTLYWKKNAISKLAEIAYQLNTKYENIGARRLHTMLETLLSDILFNSPNCNQEITIDEKMVKKRLQDIPKIKI